MNLPDKVNIFGVDYAVEEVDEPFILGNQVCAGSVDYTGKRIKVMRQESEHGTLEILFHECVHAISDTMTGVEDLTEEQVDIVSKGILTILLNNPSLCELTCIHVGREPDDLDDSRED